MPPPDNGRVIVRGHATLDVRPDVAALYFELGATESARAAAEQKVAQASHALGNVLDEHGVPADARTTAHISVTQVSEGRGGLGKRYRAGATVAVRIRDERVIGGVIDQAVRRVDAEVAGPFWTLSSTSPRRLDACREAAIDAQARASAYAAGVGLVVDGVLSISEPGLLDRLEVVDAVASSSAAPDAAFSPRGAEEIARHPLHASPGTMELHAMVDVVFALGGPSS